MSVHKHRLRRSGLFRAILNHLQRSIPAIQCTSTSTPPPPSGIPVCTSAGEQARAGGRNRIVNRTLITRQSIGRSVNLRARHNRGKLNPTDLQSGCRRRNTILPLSACISRREEKRERRERKEGENGRRSRYHARNVNATSNAPQRPRHRRRRRRGRSRKSIYIFHARDEEEERRRRGGGCWFERR